jgi:hypothetical protein
MFADIATGHTWGADVCFLLALILAVVSAALQIVDARPVAHEARPDGTLHNIRTRGPWASVLLALALGFIALGLLIL